MKTLLIDNYDSYTHILGHYIWKITGEQPITIKNDKLSLEEIKRLTFDNIVISPGPGNPHNRADTGICGEVLSAFTHLPVLGVCLGHQAIGVFAGAVVTHAPSVMHGKYSSIIHNGLGLFSGIPCGFKAVRYHSLVIQKHDLPDTLDILATAEDDGQIMAVKHKQYPYYGVQFHPESIGTSHGERLLKNFLGISQDLKLEKQISNKNQPNYQVYYRKIPWIKPETAFGSLFRDCVHSFWLDSNMINSNGAFSYMGSADKILKITGSTLLEIEYDTKGREGVIKEHKGDIYSFIKEIFERVHLQDTRLPFNFPGGWVGYFGYEFGNKLPFSYPEKGFSDTLPDSILMEAKTFLAFNNFTEEAWCVCVAPSYSTAETELNKLETRAIVNGSVEVNTGLDAGGGSFKNPTGLNRKTPLPGGKLINCQYNKSEYQALIEFIKGKINDGETYEVCLTNGFVFSKTVDAWVLYKILRDINPAPYSAYIKLGDSCILSSSPESFIQLDKNGKVVTEPIKGTRRRGVTPQEDASLRSDLLNCSKDASELLMITDLLRNDLALACKPGTIKVEALKKITEYASVLQLSSIITGKLREGKVAVDLLDAVFPGGSITGAPKKRTMEIINSLEKRRRGVYTGALGYLAFDSTMNLNIAIRTMVVQNGAVTFGAGGAIVHESQADKEWEEIMIKAKPLIAAIERYLLLEKTGQLP